MDKIVIIINEEGQFEKVLSDSEVDCEILKRGKNDKKIDQFECELEEIEL